MASTPMKAILSCGMVIMTLDMTNHAEIVCTAASDEHRDWLVGSLSAFHKVPAKVVDASLLLDL